MSLPLEEIKEKIEAGYLHCFNQQPAIEKLPQAGSDRVYFRVKANGQSHIATYGANLKENRSFFYFCDHFFRKGLSVPEVFCHENEVYFQEDLGDLSLLNVLEKEGVSDHVYELYQKSLRALAQLQVSGHEGLDYTYCLTNREFGKQAILADLLYFKYYFLDTLRLPYDKQQLIDEFEHFSNALSEKGYRYFMFRDFQSRNIMIKGDEPKFIDFQGGMLGAPQYDVASLLWQAKANLSREWKGSLLEYYIDCFQEELKSVVDRELFREHYRGYVLIRLLQVLGAYGFRGLFERRAHFLTSIPLALKNLKEFLETNDLLRPYPEFSKVLDHCVEDSTIARFTPIQANEATALTVTINSFSYKNGIPKDPTANGGGFVFDMRGILNPGRFEAYRKLSGQDKPVIDFLEQKTDMPEFLNAVYTLIDINVTDYINRGFESLMVSFGCTGGQHRSVFAAESLARHLRNKFKVKLQLHHLNKENWVR
jgi:aminoglycoside/choline kinase family phosphotransferase